MKYKLNLFEMNNGLKKKEIQFYFKLRRQIYHYYFYGACALFVATFIRLLK